MQSNTGTITDEHIRASLMSAIEDKIRRKIKEQTALCHDEIEILSQTQRELNQGKSKLDSMFDNIEKEKVCRFSIEFLLFTNSFGSNYNKYVLMTGTRQVGRKITHVIDSLRKNQLYRSSVVLGINVRSKNLSRKVT